MFSAYRKFLTALTAKQDVRIISALQKAIKENDKEAIQQAFKQGLFKQCVKLLEAHVAAHQSSGQLTAAKQSIQLFLTCYETVFHSEVFCSTTNMEKYFESRAVIFLQRALQDPQQGWDKINLRIGFDSQKKYLFNGCLGQIFGLIQKTFPDLKKNDVPGKKLKGSGELFEITYGEIEMKEIGSKNSHGL